MDSLSVYRTAYARLHRATPIPADCGRLCKRRCCQGGKEDGMILFPGEEAMLPEDGTFAVSRCEMNGTSVGFAVCGGRCARPRRPLSCRIYPLAPYMDGAGRLLVVPDPRATYSCPLLKAPELFDPGFSRAVEAAFQDLLRLDGVAEMLRAYSGMLDAYRRFLPEDTV